ncbi:unnamed protein product [Gongylonema pulchrum]|uniref:C2H2-type domain-containing protein n=1 Tax=Gongylonema pulchrum TaxID=637853 RepID=A0A183CYL4_9BILA|nr:unnamed protein product [Gongylonema pulchrum]
MDASHNQAVNRDIYCFGCSTGKKYISPSGLRTHWKSTSCRPGGTELHLIDLDSEEGAGTLRDEHCVTSTTPVPR